MSKIKKSKPERDESAFNVDSAANSNSIATTSDTTVISQSRAMTRLFQFVRGHIWRTVIIALLSFGVLGAGVKYLEEDAQKQKLLAAKDQSSLSIINPFVSAPPPSPTPQLSKEYIYAGSRLLAVEDANANAAPPADLAVWRPSSGTWYVLGGTGTITEQGWGLSGDTAVPGDFDGDGKTDFSVFRPGNNSWYIVNSSNGSSSNTAFGLTGDIPAPADFDGDGKTDKAVFRPSNGTWYIARSGDGASISQQWGVSGDVPVPADYDGDGRADLALWRGNGTTAFYIMRSGDVTAQTVTFGLPGDNPVCADYDGDGKADIAVRRGAEWIFLYSRNNQIATIPWQLATDKAVPNDYDADGKVDIAVWRNSESSAGANDAGNWFIRQSASSTTRQQQWGIPGDIPVPAYYRR